MNGEVIDDISDVESAIVWTDNPELEYFRSMMTKRITEDSLIGDSTLGDMLEYEKYEDHHHDRRKDSNLVRKSPTSVAFGDLNTSGLSQQDENNTVDNIYTDDEDESIFPGLSKVNLMGDTDDNDDDEEEISPATETIFHPARYPYQQQQEHQQKEHQKENHRKQQQQRQNRPSNQSNNKGDAAADNYNDDDDDDDDGEDIVAEPTSIPMPIPGFVFITEGPSNIYTWTTSMGENDFSSSSSQSPKKISTVQRNKERNDSDDDNQKFICCFSITQIMTFLIFVMIGASIFTAVIVSRNMSPKSSSSSSSSSSSVGSATTTNTPTSSPSSPESIDVVTTLPLSTSPTKSRTSPPTGKESTLLTILPTSSSSLTSVSPAYSPTNSPTKRISTTSPTGLPSDDITPTSYPTYISTTTPTVTVRSPSLDPSTTPLTIDFQTWSPSTFSPTAQAIPAPPPFSCVSSIATTNTCYENGDDIEISFNNCDATSLDWIGIYPASSLELSDISDNPLAWLWSCGNQFCSDPVDGNGEATMFNVSGFGEFIILLLRDNADGDGTFLAYGIGNTFRISSSCNQN